MENTNKEVMISFIVSPPTSLAAPSSYTFFGINIVERTGNMSFSTDYSAHTSINGLATSKTMENIKGS
jgi:hypothetical protein